VQGAWCRVQKVVKERDNFYHETCNLQLAPRNIGKREFMNIIK
jgi:hypothetical protein